MTFTSSVVPTRAAFLVAIGLCLCAFPHPAQADANSEARFYFERGNEQLARATQSRGPTRRRALEGALADYLQSIRIVRSKNTVYNLAVCYEELGRLEDAFDSYAEYLRADINDAERAEATRKLEAVRPRVAVIEVGSVPAGAAVFVDRRDLAARGVTPLSIAAPAGRHHVFVVLDGYGLAESDVDAVVGQTARYAARLDALPSALSIDVAGAPAQVLVDGRPAGTTPVRLSVAAGIHDVRVRRVGSEELRERVELRPGQDRALRLVLPPLPLAGGIAVRANVPVAMVSVDGVSWGAASTSPRGLVPGRHAVEVSAAGYRPVTLMVAVPEGRAVTVRARLSPVEPHRRYGALPAVSGVGAGLSLAIGALVGVAAVRKQDDLQGVEADLGNAPTRVALDSARDRAEPLAEDVDRLNTIADVGFATAVVLGAVTVVLLATSRGEETGPSTATVADGIVGPSIATAEAP